MYELFMRGMYLHFAHVKYKNIWNINTFMLRIHMGQVRIYFIYKYIKKYNYI